MQNKRALITAVVVALLGILVYSQVREWRDFDWATFWTQIGKSTRSISCTALP